MTIASNLSFLQNSAGAITTGTVNAIGSPITFSVNNTEYNRIDTNGYSLLGYTSSQGSYKLQVNGNVLINGTLSLTTASIGNITGSVTTASNIAGGTTGQLHYQTGVGLTGFVGPGTSGQILVSAGASAPVYTNTASIYVNSARYSDNITAGTTGQLVYQSAANTTGFVGPGTSGQLLVSAGASAPVYTTTSTIQVGYSANVLGGAAGGIVYQSGANASTFLSIGTAGQFLSVNAGATAPTYVSTSTMYVQRAVQADSAAGSAGSTTGALTAGTGLTSSGGTFNGSTNLTFSLNTTTLMANSVSASTATNAGTAYATIGTHTAGTGLSGTAFNGSANQTWTLNTATLMASSVAIAGGTTGQLVYQSAANTTGFVGPGTAGQFLQSAGAGAPTYVSTGTMYVQRAVLADSVTGSAGSLVNALTIGTGLSGSPSTTYNGSAAITVTLNTATLMASATQVVQSHSTGTGILGGSYNGSTAVTWSLNTATLMASSVAISGGTSGQLVYQSAANTTGFVGPGTAGQFLQSAGASSPTYVSTTTMYVQRAVSADSVSGSSGSTGNINATANTNAFEYIVGVSASGSSSAAATVATSVPVGFNASSGFVGIGNSSPSAKLHVSASADGDSIFKISGTGGTNATVKFADVDIGGQGFGGAYLAWGRGGSYDNWFMVYTRTGGNVSTERLRITQNGGVSFGSGGTNYGTSGQLLQSNGDAAPTWVNASGVSAGSATNATNVYQTTDPSSGTYRLLLGNATNTNGSVYNKSALYWNDSGSIIQGANISGNAASATTLANFTAATSSNGLSADTPNTINDIGYVSGNISLYANGSAGSQSDGGLYVAGYSTSWYHQIYGDFRTGSISVRGKNSGTWQAWRSIPTIAVSDTAPSIYNSGDLWWQSSTGRLKIRYFDGTNGQWVDAVPVIDTSLFFSKSGGAISGPVSINGALSVTGNITATAEITAYYSDRRLKTDIVTIENALVKVKKLNGVTYRPNEIAKSFGLDTDSDVVGLFADEVEQVLPQAVKPAPFDLDENGNSKSGENYKTIQYEKVVPLLVEAIKDQQKIIEEQQSKIDLLMKHLGL
jgi:hypothetical protein